MDPGCDPRTDLCNARSTEEVVAFESVVLDVEAALDSRIAQ